MDSLDPETRGITACGALAPEDPETRGITYCGTSGSGAGACSFGNSATHSSAETFGGKISAPVFRLLSAAATAAGPSVASGPNVASDSPAETACEDPGDPRILLIPCSGGGSIIGIGDPIAPGARLI